MGYVIIEDWSVFDSFYMTAISITTVGFGETKPLSETGKIFTVILIFVGLGAAAVFASHLAKAFLENHFRNFFGASKMLKKINRLKDHYIICGYGGVGSAICTTLSDAGIKFVVVEQDEDTAGWAEKRNYMTVIGKATYDSTLIQAGIKNAKGIVVSMGDDSLNMFVSLAARELNPDIFIIARGYKAGIEGRLVRAGANTVVYPIKMGGEQIAHLIKRQLHSTDIKVEATGLSSSVMGYNLKLYKHYNEDEATIADVVKRMKALNAVSLIKKGQTDEITKPEDDLIVHQDDNVLLVIEEYQKEDPKVKANSLFFWKEKYELGLDQTDLEHKELFKISAEFVEAVKSGAEKDIVTRCFNRLLDQTIEHFDNEEKLFTQYNYDDKKHHLITHKKLLTSLNSINKNRDYNFSLGVEEFLFKNQVSHILEEDKKFVDYVKENFHG